MTAKRVNELHSRDQVFWKDPDEGKCSKQITILEITIISDDNPRNPVCRITDIDGDVLECFASELK